MARKKARPARKKASRKVRKPARKTAAPGQTLMAYLAVAGTAKAIAFYKRAFGAKELYRLTEPGSGRIGHAEIKIGNSVLSLSDEYPEFDVIGPDRIGGSPVRMTLMVRNADTAVKKAMAAGVTIVSPLKDEFYGFRAGSVRDPFGYVWHLMHQIAKVTPREMQKRMNKMAAG